MVYEQVGHKGGPFAKEHGVRTSGDPLLKNMVYKQVGHKGGPFAKEHGVQTSGK